MTPDRIAHLAEPFKSLSLDDKILFVEMLGLKPAYCLGCLCTLGSPACHPMDESEPLFLEDACLMPCPLNTREENPA